MCFVLWFSVASHEGCKSRRIVTVVQALWTAQCYWSQSLDQVHRFPLHQSQKTKGRHAGSVPRAAPCDHWKCARGSPEPGFGGQNDCENVARREQAAEQDTGLNQEADSAMCFDEFNNRVTSAFFSFHGHADTHAPRRLQLPIVFS